MSTIPANDRSEALSAAGTSCSPSNARESRRDRFTGAEELVLKGDVDLSNRNSTFVE
jgi:hypothetical protein